MLISRQGNKNKTPKKENKMSERMPTAPNEKYVERQAKELSASHHSAVYSRDANFQEAQRKENHLDDNDLLGTNSAQGLNATHKAFHDKANKLVADALESEISAHNDKAYDAEKSRKVALWDAHEHLGANREAYENLAIKDATAAGHDIQFGGEHYPVQQPEEPKELQHQ